MYLFEFVWVFEYWLVSESELEFEFVLVSESELQYYSVFGFEFVWVFEYWLVLVYLWGCYSGCLWVLMLETL